MARQYKRASTRSATRSTMEVVTTGASTFVDSLLSSVGYRLRDETDVLMARVRDNTDLLMNKVENKAIHIRDRFMMGLYFGIIVAAASVFLVTALLLYMVQWGLSWATSFLIGGVLLLVAGLAFLYFGRRK
jgi:hypothetical protein